MGLRKELRNLGYRRVKLSRTGCGFLSFFMILQTVETVNQDDVSRTLFWYVLSKPQKLLMFSQKITCCTF